MRNQDVSQSDLVESFSGVRGIYGKGITEDLAYQYALAFCQLFCQKTDLLVIGGDSRQSTPALKQAMWQGFSAFGVDRVVDVGVVPVQAAEYAASRFGAHGGVYVTASHNEPEYNGWKFLRDDAAILSVEKSERLIQAVHSGPVGQIAATSECVVAPTNRQAEAVDLYINYVLSRLGEQALEHIKKARLRVLADPNGGAAAVILEKLFNRLGVTAEIINARLGDFKHLIEPKEESLSFLTERVFSDGFEFACGFDCDSDRMEFVLPPNSDFAKRMGTAVLSGQYILALACDAILPGTSNQVVVTNDATSCLVRDVIKKYQAQIVEVEVGETNIVAEMRKRNSLVGGEGSNGGVIIPPIKCRDGIMTVALIIKMLAEQKKSLLEVLAGYPAYYSARAKVFCPPNLAVEARINLERYFQGLGFMIKKTGDETGGLRAFADDNSFLFFRQSKTEPGVFRIHSEADGQEKVKNLLKKGIEAFNVVSNE